MIHIKPITDYRWTRGQIYTLQFSWILGIIILYNLVDGEYGIPRLQHPRTQLQLLHEGPHYTFQEVEE